MHLLSAQAGAIQQEGEAIDLAQAPGAYIFASSADSELAMLAGAADRVGEDQLRLANLLRLSNNLSVDMWLDQTVRHARLVVLRLIGGAAYFQYGVDELNALCANRNIPLVLLPGDANPDPILQSRSTIPPQDWTSLHHLFIAGGPENADAILAAFAALAAFSPLPLGERSAASQPGEGALLGALAPHPFPRFGLWHPRTGMTDQAGLRALSSPLPLGERSAAQPPGEGAFDLSEDAGPSRPHIPILFYRAALEGAGTATLEALVAELEARGLAPVPVVVSSLKEAACIAFVQQVLSAFPPSAIFNLTAFALGVADLPEAQNPFMGTDAPVIQLIQSGRSEAQWQADPQGLSSKDMAMYLVMPEVDGRIGGILVGHKADAVWHERTQCPLSAYAPDPGGITRAVDLAHNWARLRHTPRAERKLAIILANYPIRDGRLANGVGYDAPESTVRMLMELERAGYDLDGKAPVAPSPLEGEGRGGGWRSDPLMDPHPQSLPSRGREATPLVFGNARTVQDKSSRARRLRAEQTVPERVLWPLLKTFAAKGVKFRRQVPLGKYIADFASHHPKLVIELDGDTHFTAPGEARDQVRTSFLKSIGYDVLRFTNADLANPDGVWQTISAKINALSARTLPSPLRGGSEGGAGAASARMFPHTSADLITLLQSGPTNAHPQRGQSAAVLPLSRYATLFANLPEETRAAIMARWGDPATDPFIRDGAFHLPAHRFGNVVLLLQPARGWHLDETESYHDPNLVPPHAYVAAYLWLRHDFGAHAMVHNGKHGTLEWLPGKSAALDADCYPDALWGQLPHLYPFIVNDPGEGTQAKRRTGAVIIDHLVPPLTRAETYGPLKDLEALLDEYYAASGMDRRRLALLKRRILDFTRDSRLDQDIGLPEDETEALIRIDNFLCDLKEAQIRDGLHIFGTAPEGGMARDLAVALARVPRGDAPGDNSLIRALADDLKLGFDPLSVTLADPWRGPDIFAPLVSVKVNSLPTNCRIGDLVANLEAIAAELVDGTRTCPEDWPATNAVLRTVKTLIEPRLAASGPAEMAAFLDALDGRFIAPGPSGGPSRGRLDVLPTGRNFYSVDARAVPTPSAWELGRKSAESLVLRHLQDHGHYLKSVALSVWGTANMRTGGDDIAQAMALIGARPVWDPGSLRVSGYEIIPLARLDRPRVDVTLRISGFFRDAFPAQIALFDRAIRAIGALDEPEADNPIAARMRAEALGLMADGKSESEASLEAGARIFGSKPGTYGAGLGQLIDSGKWDDKTDLANQAIGWGQYAYGARAHGTPLQDRFRARLGQIDAVIHNQDNREHDLLDSDNYYQFEGGLSAAAETLSGLKPAAYHNDHSRPENPKIRTLEQEISHVMRSRVVNPKWLAGMMRHGYRGAFEIIATVDFMFAFAATTGAVRTHHFDLAFEAFVEDDAVRDWLKAVNAHGYDELIAKFNEARQRGLWSPRSNSAFAYLEPTP
jgi:cobalamin biosynthesis Mg chelatase CobN